MLCQAHHSKGAWLHLSKGIDDVREQGSIQVTGSVAIVFAPGGSHNGLPIICTIGDVTILRPVCGVHGEDIERM